MVQPRTGNVPELCGHTYTKWRRWNFLPTKHVRGKYRHSLRYTGEELGRPIS